jgi:hypothetical protein
VIAVLSGRAIAHVLCLYRRLEALMAGRPFEVEVSVDETESPTTNAQHVYMAHELRRLGLRCVSLAPRYISAFEKGVNYMGTFRASKLTSPSTPPSPEPRPWREHTS